MMSRLTKKQLRREYDREYARKRREKDPVAYYEQLYPKVKMWRAKNPEKWDAHKRVYAAMRNGTLKKEPCFKCGSTKSEAHHYDYSRPLRVTWLCKIHHRMADRGDV